MKGLKETPSDYHSESWLQDVVHATLQSAQSLQDDVWRVAVVAAQPLEATTDRASVASVLAGLADEKWHRAYEEALGIIGGVHDPTGRAFGVWWFLQESFGDEKLGERLVSAHWVKNVYLSAIEIACAVIAEHRGEFDEDDEERVIQSLSQRLHFLRSRIDTLEGQDLVGREPLYDRLCDLSRAIPEREYVETDTFSDDVRYRVSPVTALLSSMAVDAISIGSAAWRESFVPKLLARVETLKEARNREAVMLLFLESAVRAGRDEAVKWIPLVLQAAERDRQVVNSVALGATRSWIGLGPKEEALRSAMSIGDPMTRLQALRELAAVYHDEAGRELRETLEQLVGAEKAIAMTRPDLGTPAHKDAHPEEYLYDVALSFAGPDGEVADRLNDSFCHLNLKVFFYRDPTRLAELWGEDGYQLLYRVFNSQALYCVILLSKHYIERKWTLHELRAAQARQLESLEPYIHVVKLDDTELPGEPSTRFYASLKELGIDRIAGMMASKVLGRRRPRTT